MRKINLFFFNHARGLVILAALLMLVSCQGAYRSPVVDKPKLPQKVAGASDSTIIAMQAGLNKRGIRVISIGQDYLISIPALALFPDESPRLTWESYALLNDVACYLKQFRKVAVNVVSHSSKYISARRERALTLTRARVVADYLWSQGIDSRFIFTEGLGSDKPIIMYAKGGDLSPNSRVDITFRRTVA